MILITEKDFKSICDETDKELLENGFLTTPGSIAKLFADIINKSISDFYETLSINHMQSFVTTAEGVYLDSIGTMLSCNRKLNEDDSDFRKRICSQTLTLANGNETAIRLAVLSCTDVEDVVLKKFSHGPGSLTIVPVTKYIDEPKIAEIEDAISDIVSYGEKVIVKAPTYKYVKFNISISITSSTDDVEQQNLKNEVRQSIIKYINSLRIGESILINELTQKIMQVDDRIINYSCDLFSINNQKCLFINQGCRWDEKFIISPDLNSVSVS